MTPSRPLLLASLALALTLASRASADVPAADQPDESVLGTVEVNGSAGGLQPLPKMAIVPLLTTGQADSLVNLVVRHDMELSGQFEVLDENASPPGPFSKTTPLDLGGFRDKGAEYVVRVFSQPAPGDSTKTELVGEAYLTPKTHPPAGAPTPDAKPAFRGVVPTATTEIRAASHRLVDQLLGGGGASSPSTPTGSTSAASAPPTRRRSPPRSAPGAPSSTRSRPTTRPSTSSSAPTRRGCR
jgi:hypothetical protein